MTEQVSQTSLDEEFTLEELRFLQILNNSFGDLMNDEPLRSSIGQKIQDRIIDLRVKAAEPKVEVHQFPDGTSMTVTKWRECG
jgi:hypothetical protein